MPLSVLGGTNAGVNNAILQDPAASRAAAGLGTAATADLGGIVVPGPYADNFTASKAGTVAKNSLYRQDAGVLGWLQIVSDAETYQTTHGISDAAAVRLSAFFEGLTDIGIRANLLDGGVFREDLQPSTGDAMSLLGLSDLPLFGTPTREWNAIYFDGVNDYAFGSIVASTGARTLVNVHCGLLDDADSTFEHIVRISNADTNVQLLMAKNGTGPGQAYSYNGTGRTTPGDAGWGRGTQYSTVSIRDDAAGGASSFSMRQLLNPNGVTTYTRRSTTGEASHTLNKMRIALYAATAPETVYSYVQRLIPGWFLFDKSLSDTEEDDLNVLLGQTVFPRWSMVVEGDSISASGFLGLRMPNAGCWRAANMAITNKSVGGEGALERVADLGTVDGLNATNLLPGIPVIVDIAPGSNDLNNFTALQRSVASIHANLRTLWAYVRTTNPAATICASTIMPSSYQDDGGRAADRNSLNALIRADEGTYYDILFDKDSWIHEITATRPVYDDAAIFVQDGGGLAVHPTTTAGGGCDQLLAYMSAALLTAGVVP
jgi:hypothetical protein